MNKNFCHSIPDVERFNRQGFPEAIYCPGKTLRQIVDIIIKFKNTWKESGNPPILCTRADEKIFRAIKKKFPNAKYNRIAKMVIIAPPKKRSVPQKRGLSPFICVITAGTSDIPVAEEAAATCEALGGAVKRVYDVGVAGVHRLFKHSNVIQKASCIVVAAGMDGALPSIVGGIARCPVIGVPTSVGYGANFHGISALLTMLNSCAANVCSVNIDDGYGAGVIAYLITK